MFCPSTEVTRFILMRIFRAYSTTACSCWIQPQLWAVGLDFVLIGKTVKATGGFKSVWFLLCTDDAKCHEQLFNFSFISISSFLNKMGPEKIIVDCTVEQILFYWACPPDVLHFYPESCFIIHFKIACAEWLCLWNDCDSCLKLDNKADKILRQVLHNWRLVGLYPNWFILIQLLFYSRVQKIDKLCKATN